MKIAIVDDHQIIIDGIEMLIGLEKNIAILKTYTDACDFLQDMREAKINPNVQKSWNTSFPILRSSFYRWIAIRK